MDELKSLQTMRADVPEVTPEAERAARLRLLAADARPEPSRRFRPSRTVWRLGAVGVVAAGTLAAVTVLPSGGGSDQPGGKDAAPRLLAVANATELGERAAHRVETDPGPVAGPHQWTYLRRALAQPSARSAVVSADRLLRDELWFKLDGKRLTVSHGKGPSRRYGGIGGWPQPGRYTATDPAGLRRQLEAAVRAEKREGHEVERRAHRNGAPSPAPITPPTPADVFMQVQSLMDLSAPSPRLQAALYRLLPTLPGVGLRRDAADVTGRRGVAFAIATQGGRTRSEIILDERTYRYLGFRRVVTRSFTEKELLRRGEEGGTGERFAPGALLDWTAQLAKGVVERPGARP
ncbi:CU044_5270 family protein [Actinomadura hibisca]|uniref:CU044_5270 family protein n=1 Tax=Actinomadura hibisca TaxID=68565 RepID=UPI00082BE8BA|nr:CU044_5270 family protein [Actinomadura hibisca]